jgi:orotidine-5'-phosphate decarboxylase
VAKEGIVAATETFEPFFGREPGVVWAADVDPDEFATKMEQIGNADGLVGVKIGFEVGLGLGLKEAVNIVRANSGARVQYDHQKAGNDIPDTSKNFVRAMERGGVDSAILFPFAGPRTQTEWTRGLQAAGINVFTGAEMTHPGFTEPEGGSLSQADMEGIIDLALELGVNDFIVPGNKPDRVTLWRERIEAVRGVGNFALASPGLIDQGGDITEGGAAAGQLWTPIIGRGIHANKEMTPAEAVTFYANQLRAAA